MCIVHIQNEVQTAIKMQRRSFWFSCIDRLNFLKMNIYSTHVVCRPEAQLSDAYDGKTNVSQSVGIAYKRFAIRHGLLPEEVGKHESRTCNYKTDYPNKKRDQREARKAYGDPKKLTLWAAEQQGMKIKLKDFFK